MDKTAIDVIYDNLCAEEYKNLKSKRPYGRNLEKYEIILIPSDVKELVSVKYSDAILLHSITELSEKIDKLIPKDDPKVHIWYCKDCHAQLPSHGIYCDYCNGEREKELLNKAVSP